MWPPMCSVCSLCSPSLFSISSPSDTNLLDCSCNGMIALALGSSVYIWNSESRAPVGYLSPSPQPGGLYCQTPSVSCLCWSRDGRALCIGTRSGEIQVNALELKVNERIDGGKWFIQTVLWGSCARGCVTPRWISSLWQFVVTLSLSLTL